MKKFYKIVSMEAGGRAFSGGRRRKDRGKRKSEKKKKEKGKMKRKKEERERGNEREKKRGGRAALRRLEGTRGDSFSHKAGLPPSKKYLLMRQPALRRIYDARRIPFPADL